MWLPKTIVLVAFLLAPVGAAYSAGENADGKITLNFRNADLNAVIAVISKATGRTFVVDPRVRGKVTIIAQEPMTPDEAYQVFLGVLELNRFTVVEGASSFRIVPAQIAKQISGRGGKGTPGLPGGFITRILPIRNGDITKIIEAVRPLMPSEASITAHPTSRMIIISDRENNIRRIERIIKQLDSPTGRKLRVIRLKNGSATSIAKTLNTMKIGGPNNVIAADARINALLVSGSTSFQQTILGLSRELDRPMADTSVSVIPLRFSSAKDLSGVIAKLYASRATGKGGGLPVSIVAEEKSNSLIVSAPPDILPAIRRAIVKLDKRPLQILIEAVIFEVSAERFAELGVQFGGALKGILAGGVQFTTTPALGISNLAAALVTNSAATLASSLSAGEGALVGAATANKSKGNAIGGFLKALASDTSTNILSTPSITTLENQEASIVVAKTVPFVTGRFSTVGNNPVPNQPFQTIQRKDVGLTLKVTPQITADSTVRLKIDQEVSNLTNSASAAGGEITNRRAIKTIVMVGDKNLILLGGLLQEESRDSIKKVPFLGDLPIIKHLFSEKSAVGDKRVLLLLLRPTILRSEEEIRRATASKFEAARRLDSSIARNDKRWPRRARISPLKIKDHLASTPGGGGGRLSAFTPARRAALPLPPSLMDHQAW